MTIHPDDIKLEFFGEPLGDRSFRSGYWSFTYKGEQWEFYARSPKRCRSAINTIA